MIEQIDHRLSEWVRGAVREGVEIRLDPPRRTTDGASVGLYLLDLVPTPPARGTKRPPLQFSARYLVTTRAAEPAEAHRLLGELLFAAMESTDFEVELDPLPLAAWSSFDVAPQPSFMLRVPVRRERPEMPVKLVRQPPVIRTVPVTTLHGVVQGPSGMPVAGARVEVPGLGVSTSTDFKGRFRFGNVPADDTAFEIKVSARGREMSVQVEGDAGRPEGLVIQMTAMEG
jgi:hypothetical protein